MKRFALWAAVMAVLAGAFATWGLAQPAVTASGASPASAEQAKLPPLPADIKSRQRWLIGVKCDTPPFGYTDVRGKNAGVDVEIARLVRPLRVRSRPAGHLRVRAHRDA